MRGLLFALVVALPATSSAASGEWVFGGDVGYSLLERSPSSQHGVAAHAAAWFGLTDLVWLQTSGGAAQMLARGDSEARTVGEASVGLVLALDVFRAIPYVEASAGALFYAEDLDPYARIGVGVDYFVTRSLSLGAAARLRFVPSPLGDRWTTLSARVAYRFD